MDTLGATVRRHRFDTTEYHRMAEAGILSEDARVELVEGEVVEMSPIGSKHQAVVDRMTRMLVGFAGEDYIVRAQGPVKLDEHNEPQPDLALLKFRDDFYEREHPGPGDVLLLIEVSDSSLEYDRNVKLPLYASAGIPEVWVVDLAIREVESHSGSRLGSPAGGYGSRKRHSRDEEVASQTVPGLTFPVNEMLGD